ncbi:MAG TPA: enoyl-CoA hydratase/isomerase family protein [Solirubrobacterales bacterium]
MWLNRPERRNSLDEVLVSALNDAIDEAERDPWVKAVVLAGRGKSFCAGADLATLLSYAEAGKSPIDFLACVSAMFTRFERCPVPVVASLHGHAVAGGLELALAADVVIAADSALIGDGHIRNELIPGGGSTLRLPRRVGENNARWLLLTGELVPASSPSLGSWLHSVVPEQRLEEATGRVVETLVSRTGAAQRRLKPLLADIERRAVGEALAMELDAFAEHWDGSAAAAHLSAFLGQGER